METDVLTSVHSLGRNLICPICWSLCKEAVSVPCSHCFCRACLERSLQTAAVCPVCKESVSRRAIMPNQKVDKLVAAYMSIEAELDQPILCSQPPGQCGGTTKQADSSPLRPPSSARTSKSNASEHDLPSAPPDRETNLDTREWSPLTTCRKEPADEKCRKVEQRPFSLGGKELGGGMSPLGWLRACTSASEEEATPGGHPTQTGVVPTPSFSQLQSPQADVAAPEEPVPPRGAQVRKRLRSGGIAGTLPAASPAPLPDSPGPSCAFCGSAGDSRVAGALQLWRGAGRGPREQAWAHEQCVVWSPNAFFEGGRVRNLQAEVQRGRRMRCSHCGQRGATLGCCRGACRRSFHYACAKALACRWDTDSFTVLCPQHQGAPPAASACTQRPLQLCGSGLSSGEKRELADASAALHLPLAPEWHPGVTHVVAGVTATGAARRTLKYMMALAQGSWIVTPEWLAASVAARKCVAEAAFEVSEDSHGAQGGPARARQRVAKGLLLFEGLSFLLYGNFSSPSCEELAALLQSCGATVVTRRTAPRGTLVVFHSSLGDCSAAARLATSMGGAARPHGWVLDCVGAYEVMAVRGSGHPGA